MSSFEVASLAIPAALGLISFLSFSSQFLFRHLDPQPLTTKETVYFNINVAFLLICYGRAVLTDPGRIPKVGFAKQELENEEDAPLINATQDGAQRIVTRQRWCRICESRKPPRSHHCRICKRCIPKMDHHCPWTYNCVSFKTYPHFLRFLLYSVSAMGVLEHFIWIRGAHLWSMRHYPSIHGPAAWHLGHLMILAFANTMTLFGMSLLLARSLWSLCWNVSTIEEWELDRHETLLRRSKASGGFLDGPDGIKVYIKRQEFPYDIGIWSNIAQGMGTSNFLTWLWPFAATPPLAQGLEFETNGLEDPSIGWPPPDPDRIPRLARRYQRDACDSIDLEETPNTQLEAFRQRQREDLKRFKNPNGVSKAINESTGYSLKIPATNEIAASDSTPTPSPSHNLRRRLFHQRYDQEKLRLNAAPKPDLYVEGESEGEETWRNREGVSLKDCGLDEEAEFYDEDEIPLAQLLRSRQ